MLIRFMKRYISREAERPAENLSGSAFLCTNPPHYDLASLQAQATRNKHKQIPLEIKVNSKKTETIGVIYDAISVRHDADSSNAHAHIDNVVHLPEPMDPKTEKLLKCFMKQEKSQPFIEEQNNMLKYHLEQVKIVRDALTGLRQRINHMTERAQVNMSEFRDIKEDFVTQRKVLSELTRHFQTDKTRLQAKREIYKPILELVLKYYSCRSTHLTQEMSVFIDKQLLLIEKMMQCYDKLMIAASGFLTRIEVHIQALREILMPRPEHDVDAFLEGAVFNSPPSMLDVERDWNLIELRQFVAREGH